MPPNNPQTRFLLRGSVLLIGTTLLWWQLFLNPMLWLLRVSAAVPLRLFPRPPATQAVAEASDGNWVFQFPMALLPKADLRARFGHTQDGQPLKLRSVKAAVERTDLIVFTLSIPVYYALCLAVPVSRRSLRAAALGTGLLAAISVASVLFIAAHTIITQLSLLPGGVASWFLNLAYYLCVGVIPYAGPFLTAFALHPEFRARVFAAETPTFPRVARDRKKGPSGAAKYSSGHLKS